MNAPTSTSQKASNQLTQPASEFEQVSEEQREPCADTSDLPYSTFTRGQKLWISFVTSFAGMLSTLCSYIYYPALVPIARDLGVSIAMVNLTVTSYLLVAAVVPAIMGDMADQVGRRPVYVLMFAIFIGANVGIALQPSYPALLVLRMIQSAGSSGPVIGGSITQELGWRWVFWFLVILGVIQTLIIILFVPETQRGIVGNGAIRPRRLYWTILDLIESNSKAENISAPKRPIGCRFPNPFSCVRILGHKASLMAILLYSITYAVKMTIQASLGAQCVEIYRLNYLTAGLVYIPSGVGGAVAAFLSGKYIDKTYHAALSKTTISSSTSVGDSPDFPIEKARLKGIYVFIVTSVIETVGYGLALMTKAAIIEKHISVMIIMQFLIGFTTAPIFTVDDSNAPYRPQQA
ncbi:uncharacterized protein PG986_004554 [Apiospora aurea]|uniref:Major facilitator superfamily (MFS) profile domain-containing protein n=1 Tax=Apiospora aurea TaxID=335848 RepID=A0ABR1QMX4_9PEZI